MGVATVGRSRGAGAAGGHRLGAVKVLVLD